MTATKRMLRWPEQRQRASNGFTATPRPLTLRIPPSTLEKAVSGLTVGSCRVSASTAAAPSFNGRTVGSEPINRGSNPWGATNSVANGVNGLSRLRQKSDPTRGDSNYARMKARGIRN